jgi:acyl-coenzyme A thioesterase PaaI-like protein
MTQKPDEREAVVTDERFVAAAALRDLNHAFVAHDRDTMGLRDLAEAATAQAAAMRQGNRRDRLARCKPSPRRPTADPVRGCGSGPGLVDRAVGGRANPTSVDLDVDFKPDEVVARVVLHRAFEGAPGRAHGGIVSAVFDDVTGFVIGQLGEPSFTGELTVRFVAPVPVEELLTIRSARRSGALQAVHQPSHRGQPRATCKATHITVDHVVRRCPRPTLNARVRRRPGQGVKALRRSAHGPGGTPTVSQAAASSLRDKYARCSPIEKIASTYPAHQESRPTASTSAVRSAPPASHCRYAPKNSRS